MHLIGGVHRVARRPLRLTLAGGRARRHNQVIHAVLPVESPGLGHAARPAEASRAADTALAVARSDTGCSTVPISWVAELVPSDE